MGLTGNQEKAVAALLASRSLEDAAATPGLSVNEKTLRRWLKEPEFAAAVSEARREALEQAVIRLAAVSVEAVAALEKNLSCGRPAVEVRAAVAVLEQAVKGAELLDVLSRLAALEQCQAAQAPHANGKVRR